MIRKGTYDDINSIIKITNACAAHMVAKNIFQWNEFYPNKAAFKKDIEKEECYVLDIENKIIGCITVSTFMDPEYNPVSWLTPNKNNLYIHRLAIHPNYQRKGFAKQLMSFAEAYAKENSFKSVRLDTFSQNKRNQKFYKLRGYNKLGEIYFPKQSKHPFYCYELIL